MKINIDKPTLQKIADKVFSGPNTKSGAVLTSLELYQTSPNWNVQSHNRLILIKSALDLLPEPSLADELQRLACEKGNAEAIKEVQQYAAGLSTKGVRELILSLEKCLPEPTPVVDGKTPGQVAFEAGNEVQKRKFPDQEVSSWEEEGDIHEQLEAAASAVLAAFGGAELWAEQNRLKALLKRAEAELTEIKDYLWPEQTGLPNEHRDALIAIKRRDKLLTYRAEKAEAELASLKIHLKDKQADANHTLHHARRHHRPCAKRARRGCC